MPDPAGSSPFPRSAGKAAESCRRSRSGRSAFSGERFADRLPGSPQGRRPSPLGPVLRDRNQPADPPDPQRPDRPRALGFRAARSRAAQRLRLVHRRAGGDALETRGLGAATPGADRASAGTEPRPLRRARRTPWPHHRVALRSRGSYVAPSCSLSEQNRGCGARAKHRRAGGPVPLARTEPVPGRAVRILTPGVAPFGCSIGKAFRPPGYPDGMRRAG